MCVRSTHPISSQCSGRFARPSLHPKSERSLTLFRHSDACFVCHVNRSLCDVILPDPAQVPHRSPDLVDSVQDGEPIRRLLAGQPDPLADERICCVNLRNGKKHNGWSPSRGSAMHDRSAAGNRGVLRSRIGRSSATSCSPASKKTTPIGRLSS